MLVALILIFGSQPGPAWASLYEEGDGYLYCDTPGCHPGCDGHKHVVMIGSRGLVQDNYYLMDGEGEGESEPQSHITCLTACCMLG